MDTLSNIQSELREIAPTLAHIAPINPFRTPPNYWADLKTASTEHGEDLQILEHAAPHLLHHTTLAPFIIPNGYFVELLDEVQEKLWTAAIDEIAVTNPFQVPPKYFEQSQQQLSNEFEITKGFSKEANLQYALSSTTVFRVPESYFSALSTSIFQKITRLSEQNEEQSALKIIDQIAHSSAFRIPNHYFDHLPTAILAQIQIESETVKSENSLLEYLPFSPSFLIPDNYFTELQKAVLNEVQSESIQETDHSILDTIMKTQPFITPKDYFKHLHSAVLNQVQELVEEEQLTVFLSNLNQTAGFTVPSSYFENFEQQVWNAIKDEQTAVTTPLLANSKQSTFGLPTNYFAQLQNTVMAKIKAEEAAKNSLKQQLTLADIPKPNPFSVPVHYFEQLAQSVHVELEESSTVLDSLKAQSPFIVPPNYFDTLAQQVAVELDEPSNVLAIINQQNSFIAPYNYFSQLQEDVKQRVHSKPITKKSKKVIQMTPSWSVKRSITYVSRIAAVLAVFFVGVYFLNNDKPDEPTDKPDFYSLVETKPCEEQLLELGRFKSSREIQKSTAGLIDFKCIPTMDEIKSFVENLSIEDLLHEIEMNPDDYADALYHEKVLSTINLNGIRFFDMGIELDKNIALKEAAQDIDLNDLDDLDNLKAQGIDIKALTKDINFNESIKK